MAKEVKDVGASVRARLLNLSRTTGAVDPGSLAEVAAVLTDFLMPRARAAAARASGVAP